MIKYFAKFTRGIKFFVKKKEVPKMPKLPALPLNAVEVLRLYKTKEGYSDATVADALNIFSGWKWPEAHVTDLLAGRAKPSQSEVICLTRFFIGEYVGYCRS